MSDTAISVQKVVRGLLLQAEMFETGARNLIGTVDDPRKVDVFNERAETYRIAARLVEQWANDDDMKFPLAPQKRQG